jgi:hypothetical protein
MTALRFMRSLPEACGRSAAIFLRDVGQGLLEVSHNTLALVGLAVVAVLVFTAGREDLQASAEHYAYDWLQARQEAKAEKDGNLLVALTEPDAVARATAADPHDLTRQQAAVANWISQRYRVAPEPISRLVQEAWSVGQRAGLDPTLILAIMAVESSFNPFAQSSVGAQGLMQVMTRVHDAKYEAFGGRHAAFDPVTNLRVGVQVLKECIQRAGGLEAGLRFYAGAANTEDDGGYVLKVLAEQTHLRKVASGQRVAPTATLPTPHPAEPAVELPSAASKEAAAPGIQRVALAR